jgi:hypothetical protein
MMESTLPMRKQNQSSSSTPSLGQATPEEVKAMSDEELRLKIAEAWGFEPGTINQTSWLGYCDAIHAETLYQLGCESGSSEEKPDYILARVPYFPGDLNAIHEVEKLLTVEQRRVFNDELHPIAIEHINPADSQMFACIHATARQRCEALVLCLSSSGGNVERAQRGE